MTAHGKSELEDTVGAIFISFGLKSCHDNTTRIWMASESLESP
jgi:hypothetical protein